MPTAREALEQSGQFSTEQVDVIIGEKRKQAITGLRAQSDMSEEQIITYTDERYGVSSVDIVTPTDPVYPRPSLNDFTLNTDRHLGIIPRSKPGVFEKPGGGLFDDKEYVQPKDYSELQRTTAANLTDEDFKLLSREQVDSYSASIGADPTSQGGIDAVYNHARRLEEGEVADKEQLLTRLKAYHEVQRPVEWMHSKFNDGAKAELESIRLNNAKSIVNMGNERDIKIEYDPVTSDFHIQLENGEWRLAEPDTLQELGMSKYEMAGGMAGGVAGAKLASKLPLVDPKLKGIAAAGGAAIGGLVGLASGAPIDYLEQAIRLNEEFNSKIAIEKAIGAAELGAVTGVAAKAGFVLTKAMIQPITASYRLFKNNNATGAYDALKRTTNMSDDNIDELLNKWETLNNVKLTGPRQDNALRVIPGLVPGGDEAIRGGGALSPSVLQISKQLVNDRARAFTTPLTTTRREMTETLASSIKTYETAVKKQFDTVETVGIHTLAPPNYSFNFNTNPLAPAINKAVAKVIDSPNLGDAATALKMIHEPKALNSLGDVFALRKILNKTWTQADRLTGSEKFEVRKALTDAVEAVDKEINTVARKTEGGSDWLKAWKSAKSDYADFASNRDSKVWKSLKNKESSPQEVARAIVKAGRSSAEHEVNQHTKLMAQLPVGVVREVESHMVDALVSARTISTQGLEGIDFVKLAADMDDFAFTTSKSKAMQKATKAMAEVYTNDAALAKLGAPVASTIGDGFATSPWTRFKVRATNLWYKKFQRIGGDPDKQLNALAANITRFAGDPLDAGIAAKVLKAAEGDEQLVESIKQYQVEAAKGFVRDHSLPRIKTYSDKAGKFYWQGGAGRTPNKSNTINYSSLVPESALKARFGAGLGPHTDMDEWLAIPGQVGNRVFKNGSSLTKQERAELLKEGKKFITIEDGSIHKIPGIHDVK